MMRVRCAATFLCGILLCGLLGACTGGKEENLILVGQGDSLVCSGEEAMGPSPVGGLGDDKDETGTTDTGENQETGLYVHVCGAVMYPGVYVLSQGSRREDALLAAGGFAWNADQDYVNLAKPVADGEKLYFPDQSETAGQSPMEDPDTEGLTGEQPEGLVDINSADQALLCTLPGIGASRAEDIIAYREAHGRFRKCEDIMKVSGIKDSVYNRIKDKIRVE